MQVVPELNWLQEIIDDMLHAFNSRPVVYTAPCIEVYVPFFLEHSMLKTRAFRVNVELHVDEAAGDIALV